MDTPICNFVQQYAKSDAMRLHMPGHKGTAFLGMEPLDITEISGADSLYDAAGIIKASEENASELFGCRTYYSTEGSSHCIRAMLYLAQLYAKRRGQKPLIAAARNVHKSFVSAAGMLDLPILWLYPEKTETYLHCEIRPEELDQALENAEELPCAVYLTSPDYLGNLADVAGIARICKKRDILLLVDNAHGAYLRFLQPSLHPMDLGADLCCDSAHKTLPVITGGAYLHISQSVAPILEPCAKNALSLFGTTSPSYLILQSLDGANPYLQSYPEKLSELLPRIRDLKMRLTDHGYPFYGAEPLKLTIAPKGYGYTGEELAQLLEKDGIVCEFADPDYLVLMVTPETTQQDLQRLEQALLSIPRKSAIQERAPEFCKRETCLTIREAMLSVSETIPVCESIGRILAAVTVGCPPAVPVLVCGERIDQNAIDCFRYYGIQTCAVVARIP